MKKITKAIFPVAGLGTRFLPATKAIPKEMLVILDKPIIEWAVLEAFKSGIDKMIFVISSQKDSILEHFRNSELLEQVLKKKKKNNEIHLITSQSKLGKFFSVIQNEPKGLGHAVWCARKFIDKDERFAVILPDDIIMSEIPVTKQIMKVSNKTRGAVVALESVAMKDVSKYGIVESEKQFDKFFIKKIVEKPEKSKAPSNLSVVGRYILHSEIFKYLDLKKKGFGNEIQLTDALNTLTKSLGLYGVEFEGNRFDCGSKLGFIKANLFFGLNDKEIKIDLNSIIKRI